MRLTEQDPEELDMWDVGYYGGANQTTIKRRAGGNGL
jgi:hypothetical protein